MQVWELGESCFSKCGIAMSASVLMFFSEPFRLWHRSTFPLGLFLFELFSWRPSSRQKQRHLRFGFELTITFFRFSSLQFQGCQFCVESSCEKTSRCFFCSWANPGLSLFTFKFLDKYSNRGHLDNSPALCSLCH